jgi:outer membrane murein-binding lipoprotein Lpp
MMIVGRRQAMSLAGVALGLGCLVGMTGCDYWPPALQAQVEQLRSETQTLATEKAQLQVQINDLSNARRDLQSQLDEMSRVNREKTVMITSLQHQVDALRAKGAKAVVSAKASIKPAAKSTTKKPVKKQAAPKR